MSLPWSGKGIKNSIDGADQILVLDSTDGNAATKNKRMSITTLNTFQGLLNGIIVRSEVDFPDARISFFSTVSDNGSGDARFNFLSPHNYLDGQTMSIAAATVPAYTGFHIIKVIDANTFDVVGLTFTLSTLGTSTRCLAKDTEYDITVNITTQFGYKLVDNTRLSIVVVLGPENRITVTNGATFFKGDNVRGLAFQNIIVQGTTFTETYFKITGTNDPTVSIITWRDTSVQGFGSLGTVDGATFACADAIFPAYINGFTITNSIINVANVGYLPLIGSTSPFLDINNLQEGLVSPISNSVLPYTTTMTNLTALNAVGQFGVNINPATPLTNTFSITNTAKPIGGKMFKPVTPPMNKLITAFNGAIGVSPTNVEVSTHGLISGQQIDISGTVNYNGKFIITVVNTDVFSIPIPFVIIETGNFDIVRYISSIVDGGTFVSTDLNFADNGRGGVIVTPTAGMTTEFLDGRRITIAGTTNYNGEFKIFNVDGTISFEVMKAFNAGETATTGTGTLTLSDLTIIGSNINPASSLLITKSQSYNEGVVGSSGGAVVTTVDLPFTGTDTGEISDGSLDGTARNVLISNVSGELNSKAKGSFAMNGNSEPTTLALPNGSYTDFIYGATPAPQQGTSIESSDTESWKLITPTSPSIFVGELEYVGLEPFSGQMSVSMSLTSAANNQSFTFRAVKNGQIMADRTEKTVAFPNAETPVDFIVSVFAVTGDKFKMQVLNVGGITNITLNSIITVIQ